MDYRFHPVRALSAIEPARVLIAIAYAGGAAALVASGLGAVALWRKIALVGAGAGLLYRAMESLTRTGGKIEVRQAPEESADITPAQTVEVKIEEVRVVEEPWDNVDEASYESFPASDPPGY